MEEELDPFKEYYLETFGRTMDEPKAPVDLDLPFLSEKTRTHEEVAADAEAIKAPINAFIKVLNAAIGKVFDNEKRKGTRIDLIVTLVIGGLSFAMANLYHLIIGKLGAKMTVEEYETTFMGMYRSAIVNIEKSKD